MTRSLFTRLFACALALCCAETSFAQGVAVRSTSLAPAPDVRSEWRPLDPDADAVEQAAQFARTAVEIAPALSPFARNMLDAVAESAAEGTLATRASYGAAALDLAAVSAQLELAEERETFAARVAEIRELVEKRDPNAGSGAFAGEIIEDAPEHVLAVLRAYYALGKAEAHDAPEVRSASLAALKDRAREVVRVVSKERARPVLWLCAKGALADVADPERFESCEKFASALEQNAAKSGDAGKYFARILMIRAMRGRGDLTKASAALKETIRALSEDEKDGFDPRELPAALLAEQIEILLAEEKPGEALALATDDAPLDGAPLPHDLKSFVGVYDNPFDALNLARADAFRTVAALDDPSALLGEEYQDASEARRALIREARNAASDITDASERFVAALLLASLGESEDASALRADADERYLRGEWFEALAEYDRASENARAGGDAVAAHEIDRVAAALADRICREELWRGHEDKGSAKEWRREAAERLEKTARDVPEDPASAGMFLLALGYRSGLGEPMLEPELEYLRLFLEGKDRRRVALDAAGLATSSKRWSDAEEALDAAEDADPNDVRAFSLERELCRAKIVAGEPVEPALTQAINRIVTRLIPDAGNDPIAALASLTKAYSDGTLEPAPSALSALCDLAIDAKDAGLDRLDLLTPLGKALDAASKALRRSGEKDRLAEIDAIRLRANVHAGGTDAALSILEGGGAGVEDIAQIEKLLELAADAPSETRGKLAKIALDGLAKQKEVSSRHSLARAEALRLTGAAQEALALFAKVRKENPKSASAARGIARILSAQSDPKTIERAIPYWSDVADLSTPGSKDWWDAKEECVAAYCRIGRKDQAQKMYKTLWLTRSDPNDPGRKERWEKMLRDAGK